MIVFSRPPGRKRRAVPFLCRNAMRSKGIEGEGSDGDGAPAARANAPYALSGTTPSATAATAATGQRPSRSFKKTAPVPTVTVAARLALGESRHRRKKSPPAGRPTG